MKIFILTAFSFLFISCAGRPPFLEYSVAFTAVSSARKVNADKNATSQWVKAIRYYREAEKRFQVRDYSSAVKFFNESIKWAEKAENISRLKMSSGEGV